MRENDYDWKDKSIVADDWRRDLASLRDDVLTIQARVELFCELLPELDEAQTEVLVMIVAAINAPLSHIEARIPLRRLDR